MVGEGEAHIKVYEKLILKHNIFLEIVYAGLSGEGKDRI